MKTCIIFGAGEYDAQTPFLPENRLIIAADAGYARCLALGLTPDLVIGDFDSLRKVPDLSNLVRLPVEKDVTDMEAAVEQGILRGCKVFHLYEGRKRPGRRGVYAEGQRRKPYRQLYLRRAGTDHSGLPA